MVVGGGIFWVGGRGWTFFMGEWGWVGLVVGIFCVGGGGGGGGGFFLGGGGGGCG